MIVMLCVVLQDVMAQSNSFGDYQKRLRRNFSEYNSAVSRKYSDYLRGIWEKYKAYAPLSVPDDDIHPVVYNENDTVGMGKITVEKDDLIVVEDNKRESVPLPVKIEEETPKTTIADVDNTVNVSFYGTMVNVRFPHLNVGLKDLSNQSIADVWDVLATSSLEDTVVRDCLEAKGRYGLCDWAYFDLVQKTIATVYGDDSDNSVLLMAYILEKSGYKILLARKNKHLYVLFSSEHEIYNLIYYTVENAKYYPLAMRNDLGEIEICNVPQQAKKSLSLFISQEQVFGVGEWRKRNFAVDDVSHIDVSVNKSLLDFYSSYPTSRIDENDMTRWAMYAQTPMNTVTREMLYGQLRALVAGKSEIEAANILLNFVQTKFEYGYDDEIWGEDRAFFAEESLAYPYCDCEDRSILFSHLMRDMLDLDVALVYSPGHMFTAVRFNERVDGAYFEIGNERFVVCEPTCTTGAPVGWSAVEKDCQGIELILLSKIDYGVSYKMPLQESMSRKSLFPACVGGKYGYKDSEGTIIVPCEFDRLLDNERGDKFLYPAVKAGKISLFDCDGYCQLRNVDDYIPLELNTLAGGGKGDFYTIAKFDGKWYFLNLALGMLEEDLCLDDYLMDNVSFENNIYCRPQSEKREVTDKYIILQKKSDGKYGVLSLIDAKTIVPFEYDSISFAEGDKSKVRALKIETKETQEFSLNQLDN